ncbi:carboxylesterase/lipase family protein [Neobacillus vireti]|uniref:carboxylesterase/lipase family protein n=1 Tax=Neobacillus vireti TaxID=220686 RepID=UPI002FFF782C
MCTLVETSNGKIEGKMENGITVWKGVPYAKPPIQKLRFKPPEPPAPWNGVYDATQFAPGCPQPKNPFANILGERKELETSEDCLYLNIWSPAADTKGRPVMVFIHGGGFWFDAGSNPWYDGTSFAQQGDVVLVTINYRLGPLGFLHLAEIGGEEYAYSGNCGLLDQVQALKWIQENIHHFGGDPERVTIFGESAGATSVALLMAMPSAKGLFNQAILQSHAGDFFTKSKEATEVARKWLEILGIQENELWKLENVPVEELLKVTDTLRVNAAKSAVFQPVIDGTLIPMEPLQALQSVASNHLSVLLGTNKDEDRLRAAVTPGWNSMSDQQIYESIEKTIGQIWSEVSSHYLNREKDEQSLRDSVECAIGDFRFWFPMIKMGERLVEAGASVWMYRFDWPSPVLEGQLGCCHYMEIPFVFHHLNHHDALILTGDSPQREDISLQLHRAWIAFAHSGNPNHALIPEWPHYEVNNRPTIVFHEKSKIENDPRRGERLVWEEAWKLLES